ncbi:hypothetical protein FQR65_LT20417 [Abscondita terminalis]|nr:hypothetical protein FQR65_LT20417 [Abscondita terminalis]
MVDLVPFRSVRREADDALVFTSDVFFVRNDDDGEVLVSRLTVGVVGEQGGGVLTKSPGYGHTLAFDRQKARWALFQCGRPACSHFEGVGRRVRRRLFCRYPRIRAQSHVFGGPNTGASRLKGPGNTKPISRLRTSASLVVLTFGNVGGVEEIPSARRRVEATSRFHDVDFPEPRTHEGPRIRRGYFQRNALSL